MASLTPAVPDKAVVPANVEKVLACDLEGADLPSVDLALGLLERFTICGRSVAGDLRALCISLPEDSEARRGVQATLSEASRRLYLAPVLRGPVRLRV
ncbi:hypothetical protein [Streptomyces sp. NPDC001508]|uniref:hypothetical protein n=1 Tax=Streptomyces sp. NPDC001508 TaxID=3154656 RepID=UPI003319AB4F